MVPNYLDMYDNGEWDRLMSIINKNIMEIKQIKTGKSKLNESFNVNSDTQVSRLLFIFLFYLLLLFDVELT